MFYQELRQRNCLSVPRVYVLINILLERSTLHRRYFVFPRTAAKPVFVSCSFSAVVFLVSFPRFLCWWPWATNTHTKKRTTNWKPLPILLVILDSAYFAVRRECKLLFALGTEYLIVFLYHHYSSSLTA